MNRIFRFLLVISLFFSCSHKKHLVYLNDINQGNVNKVNLFVKNNIEIGDILKIDINTVIPEASAPYKAISEIKSNINVDLLIIDGFLVDKDSTINFPVLGNISVVGFTEKELSLQICELLVAGGHLTNPHVKVKKVNSKFTVLGEVKNPGTFTNYDNQLNIFQALGVAGDLLITAKRNNVKLLRQENGLRKTYEFSLNDSKLLNMPFYYIKSNDIIIIDPNFSKVKSAGFIGSPSSIASISSLVLSITLLLINNTN
ncbi:MAG: ligand-binding protein [Pelagibacterales bacterium]|nr:ligand-binding protein [Pelagibacterales bacterium]|tara:strand:+ start:660 stop:1430 length:771 start_codon:yes stop_codon:yes gene_type:complete